MAENSYKLAKIAWYKRWWGVVILIMSVLFLAIIFAFGFYVLALTKSLALELAPHGINVNAIAPGCIETDMVVFDGEHERDTVIRGIPAHRLGQPSDIGKVARFLCSEDSDYITGQVIHVNGGLVMG